MAGAKQGGFPAQSGESAEPGDLPTCLPSNGGVWNNPLFVPCYEGICSSDPGLVCDTLDKATEGSKCEQRGMAGKGDNLGGVTDVKPIIKDLHVVCEKTHYDYEALSDLHHFSDERWPRVVDGVGFVTSTNNELKQDDLLPKLETDVSRLLYENSVSSVSASIDDNLDGKAVQAGEIFSDFVTCVDDGVFWGNVLCAPLAEGYQSKDGGHMHDMVSKVTEGSQCGQAGLAGEGNVLSSGVEVHTSLEDLEMCSKEPHCDKGLPDLAKLGIQQLPFGMDVTCLKKDANYDLEKDGLLPNTRGATSRPMNEDSVPSISGSCIDVPFGAKAGQIAEIAEYRTAMEKVSCDSQGGVMLSCESRFWKESCGDENQCSRMEIKTSEKDLQTGQMEPCHENGCLSDSGKHGPEKLSLGADGLGFITNVNHELEKDVYLPNIDAEVSCPVDEAAVRSIYEGPIDAPLYGKAGCLGEISESRTCMEKLARDSLGVDMILCGNGFRVEASGDENHHFRIGVSKGLTTSVSKVANTENMRSFDPCAEIEFPLQQTPERDLTSYSYNEPCEDEPCCSGRETSTRYLLDHRDSAGKELDSSDHLALELATCNYTVGKACSVDFAENSNDVESQNQNSAPVIVFRRRNPRRAASSRNSNIEKSDQINKASNSTHKSKKVVSPSSLLKSTIIKFPNKTTKGRSGVNRPPKSSAWGSLQKLIDGFGQNCDPSTSHSYLTCRRKERSDRRADDKKQLTIRKSRSSRCSKNKYTSFSNMGSAVDELNGEPTFSVMADTNVSSEGHIGNVLKSGPHALVNDFDGAHRTAQCTEGNHTLKLTSIQTDAQQLEKGLENVTQEICPAYIHGECAISTSERSLNNTDVGFSPDSVLDIASVTCENNTAASLDVIVRENPSELVALTGGALRASALSTSDFRKYHDSSSMNLEQRSKTVRGDRNKRKEEICPSHAMMDDICGREAQALEKSNTLRRSINVGSHECQKKDGKKGNNINHISSATISSNDASKLVTFSKDKSSLDPSGLLLCTRPPKSGSCYEAFTSVTQDVGMHGCDSMQGPSETDNDNGKGIAFDSMKSLRREKKDDHGGKKRKVQVPHEKGKSKKKNISDDTILDSGSYSLPLQLADPAAFHMNERSDHSPATELAFKNPAAISTNLPTNVACKTDAASVPPLQRAAWVCCDDCQKWRCIPAELADVIGEASRRWTCKDNEDKRYADCSIRQEKTNAEINAELELSDASADEANNDASNSKASRAPSWTHVRSNLFLHRNRRTQSIDESMVCNCKLSQDGRMGCKDGCLNRILNIECAKRTCPCGEHCSNQQFQRRNYAKLSWFHSGKKGYGLQLKEDVSEGRFLIEYVGEVLHITAYESRQKLYASKGQKHFYFMALNGGEVIDACTKGNLGRFINHSCNPNCRTEKWMVNGEVCIGIFAMRNIKKGEELTFDYNYVRVSGAAPQKCFCGTAKCRGYIGGDISGSGAAIVQDDAEAGNFEPMAVDKDVEVLVANESCSHGANPDIVDDEDSVKGEDSNDCPSATPELEPEQQTSETLFDITAPEKFLEALSPQDSEDVIRTPVHVSRTVDCSLQQFPVYGTQPSEFLQRTPYTLDEPKAPNTMNGTTSSSDLGSNLVPGFHANKKNNIKQHKNVKASSSSIDNEHILGVERRLNTLLDEDGGISKRKDATNGYLKLLVVTAAEGDNAGGTSKSVRDLSLILGALLKTKSNAVLLDIINKNGLQMLHNILKQNRSNFLRTPIIRKLLKVLEFLAKRETLRSEHINGGPRYTGVESFRDSMLRLTRHNDIKVQRMARSFRDKWISRNMFRRKRKSRWDYQPDEHYKMAGIKVQKVCLGHIELDLQSGLMGNKLHSNWGTNCNHNGAPVIGSSIECADDEAPPGFEPQQECRPAQACLDGAVAPGLCLERYQHNLTISYGIPVAFVEHFGTPEDGDQCGKKWKVAPGVPFNPFPPLPPYPRGSPCPSTSTTQMSQHEHDSSGYCGRTVDRGGRVHKYWRNGARTRFGYNHQGRRFASNHHRFERCRAPRSEEHDDSGSRGRE